MAGKSAIMRVTVFQDSSGSFSQTEKDLSSLQDGANRAAAAIGVGLAAGAWKAVGSASDLAESANAVTTVFGDAADSVLAFSDDAAQAAGMSASQWQNFAAQTGGMLQNFGYDADEAAASTEVLGTRAADLASIFNVDLADATAAVGSGLRGEAEPLRKFGVNLDDATLKARAMELGLYDGTGALDANAKAAAAEAEILAQTAGVAGDFANTSDGVANSQRVLTADLENMSAELGNALLPYVETFIGYLRDMVEWISENTTVVMTIVGVLAAFAAIVGTINAVVKVARVLMLAWRAAMIVATYAQWAFNLAMSANPVSLIIIAIVALIAIIAALVWKFRHQLIDALKKAWDWIKRVAGTVRDAFAGAFEYLSGKISAAVQWVKDLYNRIKDLLAAGPIGAILDAVGVTSRAESVVVGQARAGARSSVPVTYNVSVSTVADSESTAREIQRVLLRSEQRNGRRAVGAGSW